MGARQRLPNLIDRSGLSDRSISRLATGNNDTVRNIRHGASPRLDTLEALCRALGCRLEIVTLHEPGQEPDGGPAVEKRTEWAGRLRETAAATGLACRPTSSGSPMSILLVATV